MIASWITSGVNESEQLDFKSQLYSTGDSENRKLAGDLAAFAHHRGGILVLGLDENEHGAAGSVTAVAIGDETIRRIRAIVASNVVPHLPVHVEAIPIDNADSGVLLLAVGPSPMRPHAVIVK